MNPIEMIKGFMTQGGNPEQLITKAMGMQSNNNPMISNLVNLARKGDSKSVEQFARNICKEKGIDFDKEFSSFMSNFNKG